MKLNQTVWSMGSIDRRLPIYLWLQAAQYQIIILLLFLPLGYSTQEQSRCLEVFSTVRLYWGRIIPSPPPPPSRDSFPQSNPSPALLTQSKKKQQQIHHSKISWLCDVRRYGTRAALSGASVVRTYVHSASAAAHNPTSPPQGKWFHLIAFDFFLF